MKLRPIPDPVLAPYPRRQKADLKPMVQITLPRPQTVSQTEPKGKSSGNDPETKSDDLPKNAADTQINQEKSGNDQAAETPRPKKQELPTQGRLGMLDDGTPIPLPFQPVDPIAALESPDPVVRLMMRQLRDMRGPMPDTSNGAVAVTARLEDTIKNRQDVSQLNDEISLHIAGDEKHNELFRRLDNAIDRERATEFYKSRSKWEDFSHACLRRGDLSIFEGMSMMSYINTQLATIFSKMDRRHVRAEVSAERDAEDLVEGVNHPTLIQNKQLQRKFDAASPQDREILRKMGFKLENAIAARITTTTETQTVEIVQPDATIPNT